MTAPGAPPATAGRRLLVVTADDFGLTAGTSRAIVEAHRGGIVSATSVLGNGPATPSTLALLAEVPDLEVGAHIALVGEDPPCCAARDVPTLVDRRGRLRASWRHLVLDLAARRVDPGDLRREIAAQIEVVASTGRPLTHLNLHQHLHLWPLVRPLAIEAALAHDIPYMRTPWSDGAGPTGQIVRLLARRLSRALREAGLATSDGFLGLDGAGAWEAASLGAAIEGARGQVVELNVHPGPAVDPDRARYRWGYGWAAERDALVDPRVRTRIDGAGFRLAGPSAVPPPQRRAP